MPDGWIPGVPQDTGNIHGWRTSRPMVTAHRTYGYWPGDYNVIKNNGLAHLLIGKDRGNWCQFGPTNALFYHCNGANDGYGIEVEGTNEEPMTPWQIECLRYVMPWLRDNIGVPLTYSSAAWVNGHTYVGVHSHNGILTDDGTWQHTNLWLDSDWAQIVAGGPTQEIDVSNISYITNRDNTSVGIFVYDEVVKRHIQPTEWGVIRYVSAVGGKGEPEVHPFPGDWFDSIPTLQPNTVLTLQDLVNIRDNCVKPVVQGGAAAPAPTTFTFTGTAKAG